MLRKRRNCDDFQVFGLAEASKILFSTIHTERKSHNSKLDNLLGNYEGVFTEGLHAGIPPERDVDHAIDTNSSTKPPQRRLYLLSPADSMAVQDYLVDLLRKKKIRRSKSPYGASLFFVKNRMKLRAVFEYRAINHMMKRDNAPMSRPDEMFDRLEDSSFFLKLYLKTGFHQILVQLEDI